MMKKWLLLPLLCLALALPVLAAAPEKSENPGGTCGETLLWELDGDTLSVFGEGAMDDFDMAAPWFDYRERIARVELTGVTKVGSYAFADYDSLTSVDFGDALEELGEGAFTSCDGLKELTFPASFRVFGEESLRSCTGLEKLICEGKFPSFRQNCLWETSVKIYFPTERPWSVELIAQLEEAFHGRVEFLASDGTDPYVPTEATEAPETTEETTIPETTEETTLPTETTQPEETQPVQTTQPETQPATQPVTVPPATEPEKLPQRKGSTVGLMILVCVLAVVCLGIIAFRPRKKPRRGSGKSRKGGRYSRR